MQDVHSPPAGVVVRSEGQRLLLQVVGSLASIGGMLNGTPKQVVASWRDGSRQPGAIARARMQEAFGIHPRAWFMLAGSGGTLAVPAPSAPPAPAPPAAAEPAPVDQLDQVEPTDDPELQEGTSTLAYLRKLLATVQRDARQADILPTERARLATVERGILALHMKAEEAAQLTEAKFVLGHPSWLRLRRTIVQALEPHPLAAQAVVKAIEAMERDL